MINRVHAACERSTCQRVVGRALCDVPVLADCAQNGQSSAESSLTLEERNGSEVPGGFMPAWRRAGEDHGLRFSLQDVRFSGQSDWRAHPDGSFVRACEWDPQTRPFETSWNRRSDDLLRVNLLSD